MLKVTISGRALAIENMTSDKVFIIESIQGIAVDSGHLGRRVLTERADVRMMESRAPRWFPDVEGFDSSAVLLPGGKGTLALVQKPSDVSRLELPTRVIAADVTTFRKKALLVPPGQRYYRDQQPQTHSISDDEWASWPPAAGLTFEGWRRGGLWLEADFTLPEGFSSEIYLLRPGG